MTYAEIEAAAGALHLTPLGGFHRGGQTTVLLGPKEPGFWAYVTEEPAFRSGGSDPLDAWSRSAISALSSALQATPAFPFGGPPFEPFIALALDSGEAWQSPVGLIVHKDAGLLVSYRGALVFDRLIDLPAPAERPCDTCVDKPCLSACPVDALGSGGYDVPRCKAHIATDPVCRAGCRVRLSCPISKAFGRAADQTAFHMAAFVGET